MSRSKNAAFRLVWLKGLSSPFIIHFDTQREANNFRLRCYNFAKPFREPPAFLGQARLMAKAGKIKNESEAIQDKAKELSESWDWPLHNAVNAVEIIVRPSEIIGGYELVARPDCMNEQIQKVFEAAGLNSGDMREALAEQSQADFMERLREANGEAKEGEPPVSYDEGLGVYEDD